MSIIICYKYSVYSSLYYSLYVCSICVSAYSVYSILAITLNKVNTINYCMMFVVISCCS